MKEHPILFSGPMVRAILDGRKTQTRRPIKPQPNDDSSGIKCEMYHPTKVDRHGEMYPGPEIFGAFDEDGEWGTRCPYGKPGDTLWVRETFYCDDYRYPDGPREVLLDTMEFRATHRCRDWEAGCPCSDDQGRASWRPSIHMPRWASRITLEVTRVRVERLQEIGCADAIAEGIRPGANSDTIDCDTPDPRREFAELWDSINAKRGYSWDANPWVWVVEFRRATP